MRVINYPVAIHERVSELQERYRNLRSPKLLERCEILLWLKTGKVKTMKEAMSLKGRHTNHGRDLWKLYTSEGIAGYLSLKYRGPQSPLDNLPDFHEHLRTIGFSTLQEACTWLKEHHNLSYSISGLGNYFTRNKIRCKTGRPNHPKRDENERVAYKKNMRKNT